LALDRFWWSAAFLPLALLLSFAIAVVVGIYSLVSLRALLVQERGVDLARTAARTADTLDRVLFERFGDIQLFADNRALVDGKLDEMTQKLLQYKKLYWYYSWIGVTDATGRIVAATDLLVRPKTGDTTKDSAEGGLGVNQADWFKKARQKGHVYLLEAQPSPESGGFRSRIYGPFLRRKGIYNTEKLTTGCCWIVEEWSLSRRAK
jgi:hypothetical protein